MYCFNIESKARPGCTGGCCSMGLDKVEFLTTYDDCKWSIRNWWTSDTPARLRSPTWATENDPKLGTAMSVFKVRLRVCALAPAPACVPACVRLRLRLRVCAPAPACVRAWARRAAACRG